MNETERTADDQAENKTLLQSKETLQEPEYTSQQLEKATDINDILDVDSNVINYG